MNCYIFEKTLGPSGTHYPVKAAVGICHNCGIAVCAEHIVLSAGAGFALVVSELC